MARVLSRDEPSGPALYLTFRPTDAKRIAQADLILHGSSGDRVLPAGTGASADATELFLVSPSSGADHLFNSVVTMRKLTAVAYVELRTITFADGTRWHASATSACRVAPSGYHLIADGQ